jgi:hypothetical protein
MAWLSLVATPASAQWVQGGLGRVWAKATFMLQRTDERFDAAGRRAPWLGNGEADSRALFTDVIVGVTPRLDVWLLIPYFDLRFRDAGDTLRTTGFGDIKAWVRWQVAALHSGQTPVALRAGAKAPVGSSPLDAQIIPVGEGQWDLELFAELGHSFWPAPAYAELWLGYRARFENSTKHKDPGGELVFLTEVGLTPWGRWLLKATLDGFFGRRWVVEGVQTATQRRIVTLQLVGGVRTIASVWAEGGVRLPLSGREFPAGPQLTAAISASYRR